MRSIPRVASSQSLRSVLLACLVAACAEAPSLTTSGAAAVGLAAPDVAVIAVGERLRLTPEFVDAAGATITAVLPRYSSGDSSVAAVSSTGLVTARREGDVAIEASMGGASATTHVRVLPSLSPGTVVDIFPAKRHQRIRGWEGTGQIGELACDTTAFKQVAAQLVDRLVNELGITRVRLGARSGIEQSGDHWGDYQSGRSNYPQWRATWFVAENDNGDPHVRDPSGFRWENFDRVVASSVIPMREAMARRGESLYVSLNFVDFWLGAGAKSFPHMKHPEEYAELILAVFDHMRETHGFTPDGVELVLEPENTPYSGADIGRSLVTLARRLREAGYRPDFIGPSTTRAANAPLFYDQIVAVPGARGLLTELSYHRYGGVSRGVLRAIRSRALRDSLAPTMLEHIGSGFDGLYEDLTVAHASAWEQFALAYCGHRDNPENRAVYYQVNDRDAANPRINITNEAKLLRQVFAYVRPGDVRVGAVSSAPDARPLAFRRATGGLVVVIRAADATVVSLRGLPAGAYGVNYSTRDGRHNVDLPDLAVVRGMAARLSVPANAAVTIHARNRVDLTMVPEQR